MKLFETKFEIVEVHDNGVNIKYTLKGKRSDVKKDIETFKEKSIKYEMIGKKGMIVWV